MFSVILVRTQLPENLGAVARAMGNFCFKELRLVNPLCDPIDPKAIAMSAGNEQILQTVKYYNSLQDAISDCQFVYATSAKIRDIEKPCFVPEQVIPNGKTAIVFGPERTGLTNDEISLCQGLIQIPVNENFSSLNIAQSAVVIFYEIFKKQKGLWHFNEIDIASNEMRTVFLAKLEHVLDYIKFWRTESKKPVMWRNIQNTFTRHTYTTQEIKTLTGIIVDILKRFK